MRIFEFPEELSRQPAVLKEITRIAVDGTVSPMFVDYANQRVLVRETTASASDSLIEFLSAGRITTGGVWHLLSSANLYSALNITGTTNSSGNSNWLNITAGLLSVTSTANLFGDLNVSGSSLFLGNISSTGIRAVGITSTAGTDFFSVRTGTLRATSTGDFNLDLNVTGNTIISSTLRHRNFASCSTILTGAMGLENATEVVVTAFGSNNFDTDGMHSNTVNPSRIKLNKAGIYKVGANLTFDGNTTGTRYLVLRLNGATTIGFVEDSPNTGSTRPLVLTIDRLYSFAANDYVEVLAQQNSGGAINLLNQGGANYFYAVYIGEV